MKISTKIKKVFANGVKQFTEHPQLLLTIFVALAILTSFIYITGKFANIAKDTQEELINVRIGSIHDAFAPFVQSALHNPDKLREYMQNIVTQNPTITDFAILRSINGQWYKIISINKEDEFTNLLGENLILSVATSDPTNSFTVEETGNGSRFFKTFRAVTDEHNNVVAVLMTKQSLSAADNKIRDNLKTGQISLILILLFLMLLFFKHARIIDYTVLYRKLKEVDTMKNDFISMASHELRTPLTAIRGYADILKGKIQDEEEKDMLCKIDISARNLDDLIKEILDVSKIESGGMKLDLECICIRDILNDIVEELLITADNKGLKLIKEIHTSSKIKVDISKLRQILINLIGNAIKYTNKGEIKVIAKDEDEKVVVRISDTGIGMTSEERNKLFEKFYRVKDKEVYKQRGTGLGLWITKQLTEKMSGKITVESIKGVGSHFVVEFHTCKD